MYLFEMVRVVVGVVDVADEHAAVIVIVSEERKEQKG